MVSRDRADDCRPESRRFVAVIDLYGQVPDLRELYQNLWNRALPNEEGLVREGLAKTVRRLSVEHDFIEDC